MEDHVLKHVIFKRSNASASYSEMPGAEPARRRAGAPSGRHRHPPAAGPLWRPCGYFRWP